jgi:hypothetical protein
MSVALSFVESLRSKIFGLLHKKVPVSLTLLVLLLGILAFALPRIFLRSQVNEYPGNADQRELGVAELVRKIKGELVAVDQEQTSGNQLALFRLKDFELEISFVVHHTSSSKGTVQFEFLTVDNDIQVGAEKVQKLTLRWEAAKLPPAKLKNTDSQIRAPDKVLIEVDRPKQKKKGEKP